MNYSTPIAIRINALEGQTSHEAQEYLWRKEEVKTPYYGNHH